MRFLSVAGRELRAAARRKTTHRARWVTGLAFFALLIWLIWVHDGFRYKYVARQVFNVYSTLIFFYCLIVGTAQTADCISSEKREGTLGLLFLTNLNSAEIVAGKLCSSALTMVYGLFAIFPMLALPLLMGGVTFDHFWRTVLALVSAIFFSLAAGFVASTVCVRQFTAIATATGLSLIYGVGLLGGAAIVDANRGPRFWVETLSTLCPLYSVVSADGGRTFGQNHYWLSLLAVAGMSLIWLMLVAWRVGATWRDRPKRGGMGSRWKFWKPSERPITPARLAMRRRLLDINPFLWLGGRSAISSPGFMLIVVLLMGLTVYVVAPFFHRMFRGANNQSLAAFMFAWFWLGLAVHALVFYYAAMTSSQRLAEDKQAGALELILSTPTTEKTISRGLWMAFWRQMFFPGLAVIFIHLFFIWQGAAFLISEVEQIPRGTTPGALIWRALFKLTISNRSDDWTFWLALRMLLLALLLAVVIWFTLGWLGRWLGLKMKHPGFAPLVSLVIVFVPPVLVFSLLCYVAGEMRFYRMSERIFIPAMMWTAFGIGVLHCALVSRWSAVRLQRDFRTTVTSRFQPPPPRFWWLPGRRTVLRVAIGVAALVAVLALGVFSFYTYQNWHSRRNWSEFQKQLAQKGGSLDITPLMPLPVPDPSNFAKAAAFQRFHSGDNGAARKLFNDLQHYETAYIGYGNNSTTEWIAQRFAPLADHLKWAAPKTKPGGNTNRTAVAPLLLEGLEFHAEMLQAVSTASQLPFFQTSTNQAPLAVLQSDRIAIPAMERLHFLFCIRACASLAMNQSAGAGEDLLTGLNLARLARQSPDARSTTRVQVMLARSFQPLWEGLAAHQWNEPQLRAFQTELVRFNLLADHTNAVRRVVLAHMNIWQAYPDTKPQPRSAPIAGNSYIQIDGWPLKPRAWWFDECIQLHQAAGRALEQIDVPNQQIRRTEIWGELRGLPLGGDTEQLIGQYQWWWPTTPAFLAFAQNSLNQAVLACALERFYVANGKYPETLEELVPAYLDRIPNDVVRGRPVIYQRTDDGRYILRGVGQNGQDDRKKKTSDDWLWWYSTNAPPVLPQRK